ncbi:MAG: hypothetical protein WAN02_16965, partial [Mycobacterium sp.]
QRLPKVVSTSPMSSIAGASAKYPMPAKALSAPSSTSLLPKSLPAVVTSDAAVLRALVTSVPVAARVVGAACSG